MNELETVIIDLIEDRGFRKVRVNLIKDNKVSGWIKPV